MNFFMDDEIIRKARNERIAAYVKKLGDDLRVRGIIGKKKHHIENPKVVWHKFCVECGKELPEGLARVCSGECYVKNPMIVLASR